MSRRAVPRDLSGITAHVALASAEIVWDNSAKTLRLGSGDRAGGERIFTDQSNVAYGLTGVLQSLWGGGFENNTRHFVGNPIGRAAIAGFTRSSDNPTVGDMGTYAIGAFTEHDSDKYAWAGYDEIRVRAGAGAGHGREIAIVNFGDPVETNPYNPYAANLTDALRLSVGRGDTPTQTDISAFAHLVSVGGAKALKGLVFGYDSLVPIAGGQMDAINVTLNMAIQQWTAIGRASRIRFDTTNPAQATNLIFANDIVSVQGPEDDNYATFGPQVAAFIGAVTIGHFTKAELNALPPGNYLWATAVVTNDASNRRLATSDGVNWRFQDGVIVPAL